VIRRTRDDLPTGVELVTADLADESEAKRFETETGIGNRCGNARAREETGGC
jgi:hypothetical protein